MVLPRSISHIKLITRSIKSHTSHLLHQDMVAPRLIAAELLKKRKGDKQRSKNTILNSADIQVLGSFCQGHRPSLLVNSEGSAYLFNCAEGTQRNCYTNKVKLLNLEHLFVTNLDWPSLSGAYGLSLTVQDLGIPSFTLHGPEGIEDFFNCVKSFLSFTTGIECKIKTCDKEDYQDQCITVKSVVLNKNDERDCDGDVPKRLKKASRLVSYVCTLPDLPGSLDPQKCRDFQVPVGPKLAILKSGCDITLDDGTIVRSSDVCGPKNRGLRFIVVDCPTVGDINLVIGNHALEHQRRLRLTPDQEQIDIVIHYSPENVCSDPKYSEWMDGFPDNCKHMLLSNSKPTRPNFIDSYRLQYLLRQLDEDLFPALELPEHFNDQVQRELSESSKTILDYGSSELDESELRYENRGPLSEQERVYKASALDKLTIRPLDLFYSAESKILVDAAYKSASLLLDFQEDLKAYQDWRNDQPAPARHEPEFIFLGTGSALPSKLRNTTCILVNMTLPRQASLIMDCGEDSYGQMVRFYGHDGVDKFLKRLELIYISHHHADHHIGLIEVLRNLKRVDRSKPVLLLAPPGVDSHIAYYNYNFEDLNSVYTLISTRALKSKPTSGYVGSDSIDSLVNLIRRRSDNLINDIKVVGVEHCAHSCAVTINLNIGQPEMESFKISYSGDARPSEDFVIIGRDCDLLIHEATFDHREQASALEKKHCTTIEAIEMAKRMRAKYTILTHFSQRYPKIPYFTKEFDDTIGYAFDYMSLRCPSHYDRLPRMKKIMSNVFSKSLNEIDGRFIKMTQRKRTVAKLINNEASTS